MKDIEIIPVERIPASEITFNEYPVVVEANGYFAVKVSATELVDVERPWFRHNSNSAAYFNSCWTHDRSSCDLIAAQLMSTDSPAVDDSNPF